MGWFGMPGMNKQEAFDTLFSQAQYDKPFELIWHRHIGNKSIAVYILDGKYGGETVLWGIECDELMYKSLPWSDSSEYIPKKIIKNLLKDATEYEIEQYREFEKLQQRKDSIKDGTVVRLDFPVKLSDGNSEDTFMYQSDGRVWAVDLKKFVTGISKSFIVNNGFTILSN